MIRLNILATDENVEKVRETARQIECFKNTKLLKNPLSPTGELPVTHWICNSFVPEDVYESILSLQEFSEVTTNISKKKFLESKGLKKVKKRKFNENTE